MAFLGAAIPAVIGIFSSIDSGNKAKLAGYKEGLARDMEAKLTEKLSAQYASNVKGAAQREAMDEEKRADLLASRAVAVAAASGGGVSDPSVSNLIADIYNEGAYRKSVALYQGEEQARQLKMKGGLEAYALRREGALLEQRGRDQQSAYNWQAAGYAAQGGSSLYSRYATGKTDAKTS